MGSVAVEWDTSSSQMSRDKLQTIQTNPTPNPNNPYKPAYHIPLPPPPSRLRPLRYLSTIVDKQRLKQRTFFIFSFTTIYVCCCHHCVIVYLQQSTPFITHLRSYGYLCVHQGFEEVFLPFNHSRKMYMYHVEEM